MKRLNTIFNLVSISLLFVGLVFVLSEMIIARINNEEVYGNTVCHFFTKNMVHHVLPRVIQWDVLYPVVNTEEHTESDASKVQLEICDKYLGKVKKLKQSLQDYSTKYLPFYYECSVAKKSYDNLIGWDSSIENKDLFKLDNGYYGSCIKEVKREDMKEIGQSIYEFSLFLKEERIPFLYVNAANKVKQGSYSGYKENVYYGNQNANNLLNYFDVQKIDYLDTRRYLREEPIDNNYYKYDHHWKPYTAFRVASLILNKMCIEANTKYYSVNIGDVFSGSIGRRLRINQQDREAFEYLIPDTKQLYRIEIPNEDYYRTGSYDDVFINHDLIDQIMNYDETDYIYKPDAYAICRISNYAHIRLENLNAMNNIKVLLLFDSFSWYLSTYLLQGVRQIDMIYRPNFHGSIRSFVEKEKPDKVLMVISQDNIGKIDWHIGVDHRKGAFFDLR